MARRAPGPGFRCRRRARAQDATTAATTDASILPCDVAREAISALADGEQPPVPKAEVDAHTATCVGCRAFQRGVASLSRQLRVRVSAAAGDDAVASTLSALTADADSIGARGSPGHRRPASRAVVRAMQWAAGIVPLGIAAPALALGAFTHQHFAPSHFPTPCTTSLLRIMGHG